MSHEMEDATSIEIIAAGAAAKFADVEANAGLIREEIRVAAQAAYNSGQLVDPIPSPTEMFEAFIARKVDVAAKRHQAKVKSTLAHGQGLLDFGFEFDSIVLVCGKAALGEGVMFGRMTTLGLLSADDLALIGSESSINRTMIQDADDRLQAGVRVAVPRLRAFRSYRAYCEQASERAS